MLSDERVAELADSLGPAVPYHYNAADTAAALRELLRLRAVARDYVSSSRDGVIRHDEDIEMFEDRFRKAMEGDDAAE